MLNTNLISGRFVKREDFDPGVYPTDEDIDNFVRGYYGKIGRKALKFLKELEKDPYGKKWDADHADCIFCSPDWLFEILFVYFPTSESWEQNYQQLRALVGPEPLDYVNVHIAVSELYRKQCEAAHYEPPLSKRAIELLSSNPHWRAQHPEYVGECGGCGVRGGCPHTPEPQKLSDPAHSASRMSEPGASGAFASKLAAPSLPSQTATRCAGPDRH